MKTCLKVVCLVILAVLLAAGAALACDNPGCLFPGCDQDLSAWLPAPADGMRLACTGGCNNSLGIEKPAAPAAAGQKKPQPGMLLACGNPDCLSPGLNDERLAAATQRLIMVCIAETCGLTPDLASIMLTCGSGDGGCFAPVNPAEQTATR
jgi:hypothetical protein